MTVFKNESRRCICKDIILAGSLDIACKAQNHPNTKFRGRQSVRLCKYMERSPCKEQLKSYSASAWKSHNQGWVRWKSVNLTSVCKLTEGAEKRISFLARSKSMKQNKRICLFVHSIQLLYGTLSMASCRCEKSVQPSLQLL